MNLQIYSINFTNGFSLSVFIMWSGEALSRSVGQDISRCIWTRMSIAIFIGGSNFTISSDESTPHTHISFPTYPS